MDTPAPHEAPGQDSMGDPTPEAFRGDGSAMAWTVVFGIILALMALSSLYETYIGVQAALDPDGEAAQSIEENVAGLGKSALYLNALIILVAFGLIPLAWVALTRVRPHPGTWRYLHLDWRPDSAKRIGQGVALGLLMWLTLIVLTVIQLAIEGNLDSLLAENATNESPVTQRLIELVDWPLAILIALVAGTAEEVFFRGVLQRWIGWWGQAILFGLTHAGYGTVAQIVIPFAIGLLFGWLVKKGKGLYLVMAAHFAFDFVQLAIVAAS